MRKFNKNCLVFTFAVVMIIFGFSGNCFESVKWELIDLVVGIKNGNLSRCLDFSSNIDRIFDKELSYHDSMMDVNSVKENVLGTRIVKKEDATVVKNDKGSLAAPTSDAFSLDETARIVGEIEKLKLVTEKNNGKFLYCAAPSKEYYGCMPSNVVSKETENFNTFLSLLTEKEIPFINLVESLREHQIADEELFFTTDHHWRPHCGLAVTKSICEELCEKYGFVYHSSFTDIEKYRVDYYRNWFLGSYGKKVGTFFTWQGADDFELIVPSFETSITEIQPMKNQVREGSFEDTVLFQENLEKDYYHVNSYATYSGGDFRLQIMKNNLNRDGKKVLMIRDSFACVVAPFLSLQTSELHICDMRNFENFVGEKVNVEKYIESIHPDYVMILYSGVKKWDSDCWNFY